MPRLPLLPALAMVLFLFGCDARKIAELEEGVSTEQDVRARFGTPAAEYDDGGGVRTLEYPRQPEGQTNLMVSIGPDGRMSALRQVLKPSEFAKVTPGLAREQVRRLLGRPARTQAYALRQEEVWDWRFLDGAQGRVFSVTFDAQGRVLSTATTLDPRESGQVGG